MKTSAGHYNAAARSSAPPKASGVLNVLVRIWLSPGHAARELCDSPQGHKWTAVAVWMCIAGCVVWTLIVHSLPILLSIGIAGPIGLLMALINAASQLLIYTLLVAVVALLCALLNWFILFSTGGLPTSHHHFRSISAAAAAASAPLLALPIVGFPLFVAAGMFLTMLLLRHASGARTGWRIAPQLLIAGTIIWLLFTLNGTLGVTRSINALILPTQSTRMIQADIFVDRLNQYALVEGSYPRHPVEMVPGPHYFPGLLFCADGSMTTPADLKVGSTRYDKFSNLSEARQRQLASRAAAAIADDTSAIRFGDYIFTAPGIDPTTCSNQLWVFILLPDPSVNGHPQPTTELIVGTVSGRLTKTTLDDLRQALSNQNVLREKCGLAPLTDLA